MDKEPQHLILMLRLKMRLTEEGRKRGVTIVSLSVCCRVGNVVPQLPQLVQIFKKRVRENCAQWYITAEMFKASWPFFFSKESLF